MNAEHLSTARLQWDSRNQPRSQTFDDLYFSRDQGWEETQYVFLENNRLHRRWREAETDDFTLAETGFGTGLNFLAAAELWLEIGKGTLHYLSAEKYPLTAEDLVRALGSWPRLAPLARELAEQYPPLAPGRHRLSLAGGRVQLTLLFGDAAEMFAGLADDRPPTVVDAWFLDGFAPAKNPQMWTPELFRAIARLSGEASSFSTFTAAGSVRRGLAEVGFGVEKVPGFGSKREMLRGRFHPSRAEPDRAHP